MLLDKYKEIREGMEAKSFLIFITDRDHVLQTIHSSLPNSISFLLQDYDDVLLKGLPSGLPPIWGIEHQIDFVSGSQWPNTWAYQSDSEDINELQRQVEELLNKGNVRESSSLCAITVLLVPKKNGTWRMCFD